MGHDADAKKAASAKHDVEINACTIFKYGYSVVVLIFSLVVISGLIVEEDTNLSRDIHPALAFVVIVFAIGWLGMVEGSQASLVGLPPIDRDLYKDSHPMTYKITDFALKGDNLDRYLMGRQFMVLLIVFVTNLAGAPLNGAIGLVLPNVLHTIFVISGMAMTLMTANIGQLATQVNASHCMLDYINNYFALFTVGTAMLIEFSGVMHASYLIQMAVASLAGKKIVTKEDPRNLPQAIFFYLRCFLSVVILIFSFVVTIAAIFERKTTMWPGVPEIVSLLLFFFLMSIVGMLEGMQIAFFAAAKLPEAERGDSTFAKKTCELLFAGNGQNLPGFMVGRQLCVVSCFFIVARTTTLDVAIGTGENILGVPDGVQAFLNTGLHAAVITTIVASISWQLVASAFPLAFMNSPITYILLQICLLLEASGICAAAWVLAFIHKKFAGFQYDEVYVGTPEERVARQKADREDDVRERAGHLDGSGFPAGAQPVGSGAEAELGIA